MNVNVKSKRFATLPERAPTAAPKPKTYSQSELDCAVYMAALNERSRIKQVFGHKDSVGRERNCAELLTASEWYSAEKICKHLAHMPTDRESAGQATPSNRANIRKSWDDVRAEVLGETDH